MPGDITRLGDPLASHFGGHLDVHDPLAGQPAHERLADVALDLGLEWAGGRRQVDGQRYGAVADLDILDHAQVDQVATEVRVLDSFQCVEHVPFGEGRVGLAEHQVESFVSRVSFSENIVVGAVECPPRHKLILEKVS